MLGGRFRMEPSSRERHPLKSCARTAGSSLVVPTLQPFHDRRHADGIGVTEESAAERREPGT